MSEHSMFKFSAPADDQVQSTSQEINLRLNLRLRLDDVVDATVREVADAAARPPSRKDLCRLATRIYEARCTRNRMLNDRLFGEPAWDMLLALYCLPAKGERMTSTSLACASNVPQATAFRWQSVLMDEGLIERGPAQADARLKMMRLTDEGRSLLEKYLTRIFYFDAPTPPFPEAAGG